MTLLRPFLLFTLLFLADRQLSAQADTTTYTDISKVRLVENIMKSISSLYTREKGIAADILPGRKFTPGKGHKGTVPAEKVTSTLYLRFHILNSADTSISVYFFPGFYFRSIVLYQEKNQGFEKLPNILPVHPDSIGFRKLTLNGKDSATIVAELHFVRTYINNVNPRLVNPEFLPAFNSSLGSRSIENDLMTYIFCGLLLMMILFSLANFLQGANPEFLYYSGYAFFLGSMLFTKAIFNFHSTATSFFIESYLDFIFQCLGITLYMLFMQRFLETKQKHPFLYSLYNFGIAMLVISMAAYTYFHYFTDRFTIDNGIENATKILLLFMIVVFLIYSLGHWRDKLLRYLFWGNLFLLVFSMMSQYIIMNPSMRELPGLLGSSLFYYEIGLLLELIFFLAGLNQKNRSKLIAQTREREGLKAQNQLKEYEKELAVYKAQQEERERISADMHDELGSRMTAIRLMSEIARNKMKENTPVEIDRISSSADDVLNKMNAIIWSMNSGNDTVDNLVSYIRSYALEYFENTPIQCKVNTPSNIPDLEITGDKRRNIFLCIKETLHNALKHSKASLITISIETDQELKIIIQDNGVGIDNDNLREFGNGLKNIRRRMESIGGTVNIENANGVRTTLILDLSRSDA